MTPDKAGNSDGRMDDGAQGRDRTTDTAIFSRMLYQLSYLGIRPTASEVSAYRDPAAVLSSP